MAIDINIAIFVSISPLILGLVGLLKPNKVFAIFPFMGAILAYISYSYLAADGQIAVSGTNYSDYPFILVPLFMGFGCLAFCIYKASPSGRITETLFLAVGLGGIDAYFVPTTISGLATANNVNLPSAMLGFVQQYGEVSVVGVSAILMVYALWSIWFK